MQTLTARLLTPTLAALLVGWSTGPGINGFEFVSPKPGSTGNSRESTIIIREGSQILAHSVSSDVIFVTGSTSGHVTGSVILSSDGETVVFKPDRSFAAGEHVEVSIRPGILTAQAKPVPTGSFEFEVTPLERSPSPYHAIPSLRPDLGSAAAKKYDSGDSPSNGWPPMMVEVYDSAAVGEGYIFLAVASHVEGIGYHLMMLNNDGSPFFSRELDDHYAYDFKMQPNGQLTYAHFIEEHSYTGGGNVVHKVLDDSFTLVDSVQMGNGYVAEAHDFQILPNGHYLLFGYYLTPVDMSQIVEGGQPDALVSGGIVQELDSDKNVIFQWRSWDYHDFESYPFAPRTATRSIVSEFHLNTINLDDDGHLFLATPSWVKKINRLTGETIWNLGGDFNEFSFSNVDSTQGVDMVGGHAFHRLPNGNVLLYDNGNRPGTKSSRVHELSLDEENRIATLVWSWEPETPVAGWHRGNAQRLPNGNTVIGWGGSSGNPSPAMTEVNAAGDKVYELTFDPPDIESYRAFRFPFNGGSAAVEVTVIEVAPGNTYDFAEGDSVSTGISIEVKSTEGSGYNDLTVKRFAHAPLTPKFPGTAPRVQPVRMVLEQTGLTAFDVEVQFDVDTWEIDNPEHVVVYHREFEGRGLFIPIPTSHNPAKNIVVASTSLVGEFILATPEFDAAVFTPLPLSPADSSSVNETVPVEIEWSPVGRITSYDLQIAPDAGFTDLLVDEADLTSARYILSEVDDAAVYFWRVRSRNEANASDWTEPQMFMTTAPFVQLTSPSGGEEWTQGLDVYIRWSDNLVEDVVIELHRHDAVIDTIAVTPSDGAHQWEVDLELPPGPGYTIKIFSSTDPSILDANHEAFSIVAVTAIEDDDKGPIPDQVGLLDVYPNPFSQTATIAFDLPAGEQATLAVYDIRGRLVAGLLDQVVDPRSMEVAFDGRALPDGIYFCRLTTLTTSLTRKMVLVR